MPYNLVIVESPAKCDKIEKILGPGYKCVASYGHLQQLSTLKDIDIMNNFKPSFTPIETKKSQINKLKGLITHCEEVILATDDDREGEGIAWHICSLFNLSFENTKRIIFHEITASAITAAIKNPTTLDMNMVNAQQGRQILDLLVGFSISPVLWHNITFGSKKGLSAGRCQTPAVRLIYDNQKEIDNAPGKKVYNTTGYFTDKNLPFTLNYAYDDEEKMAEFLEDTVDHKHVLSCEKPKDSLRKAPQPFTTSTLQQTASNELHISPKETMSICQKLYEGGYITYMRTDSKVYSKEFIEKANTHIIEKFGAEFEDSQTLLHIWPTGDTEISQSKPKKAKKEKEKKAKDGNPPPQEAHEAIRPTNVKIENIPEEDFSSREVRLYKLIWRNTVESCMADAIYKIFNAKITAPQKYEYRYLTEQIVFPGWKLVNGYEKTNPIYNYLTNIKKGDVVYKKIVCKLTMKDLKTHYTEAKLVQLLEQRGIGRPSTFSALVEKIQERGYVAKENIKGKVIKCTDFELENDEITEIENKREFGNEKSKLVIQPIGIIVVEFLIKTYTTLFEYEYTKNMEDVLDTIAKGQTKYYDLCKTCLNEINKSSVEMPNNKITIKIDDNHIYMVGKNGPVIKCTYDSDKATFKSVKKDIDLDKLRDGHYKLEDIVENSNLNKKLGIYKNQDLILKKGKFGLYVIWGENKKSLSNIKIPENDITLENIIPLIEISGNENLVRKINNELTIRKGQYGDYIFYKTSKMTKPRFHKLNGFTEDYKTCTESLLTDWIKEKYKINV